MEIQAIELRDEKVFAMNALRLVRGSSRVGKKIVLTFDDAPNGYTEEVLAVLEEFQVKAAFFLIGARVVEHPELARRIVTLGHEIGNHSFSHAFTKECSVETIKKDVERAERVIVEVTGSLPLYFRPPFGLMTPEVREASGILGYTLVSWSIDSGDWKVETEEEVVERVLTQLHPGAIVLFHLLPHTVRALPRILQNLKEAEYECVPLSFLLEQ